MTILQNKRIDIHIHAFSEIRTHGPGVSAGEDSSCLILCGNCDRLRYSLPKLSYWNQLIEVEELSPSWLHVWGILYSERSVPRGCKAGALFAQVLSAAVDADWLTAPHATRAGALPGDKALYSERRTSQMHFTSFCTFKAVTPSYGGLTLDGGQPWKIERQSHRTASVTQNYVAFSPVSGQHVFPAGICSYGLLECYVVQSGRSITLTRLSIWCLQDCESCTWKKQTRDEREWKSDSQGGRGVTNVKVKLSSYQAVEAYRAVRC
jgi:hypothetical protein